MGTRAHSAGRRGSLPALAKKTGPGFLPKCTAGGEAVAIHLKEGMFRVGIRTRIFTLRTVRPAEAVESSLHRGFKDRASGNLNLIVTLF